MLGNPKIQTNIICSFFFLAFLIILSSIAFTAKAQSQSLDPIDTVFETARGQLLGVYNSEVVTHAGIILGLIVAFASVAPNAWKAVHNEKKKVRFLGASASVSIVLLFVYSVGRLFYWSALSGTLIGATRSNIGATITSSNATYCLNALSNFTIESAKNAPLTITSFLANSLHPNNWVWLLIVGGAILVISSYAIATLYDPTKQKGNNQNTNEQKTDKQKSKT